MLKLLAIFYINLRLLTNNISIVQKLHFSFKLFDFPEVWLWNEWWKPNWNTRQATLKISSLTPIQRSTTLEYCVKSSSFSNLGSKSNSLCIFSLEQRPLFGRCCSHYQSFTSSLTGLFLLNPWVWLLERFFLSDALPWRVSREWLE